MSQVDDEGTAIIEDGVLEIKELEIAGRSGLGLTYLVKILPNPQLTTILSTSTDSTDFVATITSILATAVA